MEDTPSAAKSSGLTYRHSGVDIAAGEALVKAIAPLAAATRRPGAEGEIGGFGGLFDLAAAGFADPVLVAATDGVGTKLKLASATGRHDTVGRDLVAMCVNDLLAQGAEPLFFLDYFATGRLDAATAEAVIAGIAAACREAGCALIGGETAEMPGMYEDGAYDLAGFAVGAAERDRLLPRADLAAGDALVALAASGLHSNGFSLVRRVVERARADLAGPAPFDPGRSLGEALLEPTRIYVRPVLDALRAGLGIKALAHITGGGIAGNLPRVLPGGLAARIDLAALPVPPVFGWLAKAGEIAEAEMLATFNCGAGMIAAVAAEDAAPFTGMLQAAGVPATPIGGLVAEDGAARVRLDGGLRWP